MTTLLAFAILAQSSFPAYTVRTDSFWLSQGVKKTTFQGKERITLQGSNSGIKFDPMGYGEYQIVAEFPAHMIPPGQYYAFWIRNDLSTRSVNYENSVEFFYTDPNAKNKLLLTVFDNNDKILKQSLYPSNSFLHHRITISYLPTVQRALCEGLRGSEWVSYAFHEVKRFAEPGATLRIGIWGTPLYPVQYRGPERIVLHSVRFSAFAQRDYGAVPQARLRTSLGSTSGYASFQ